MVLIGKKVRLRSVQKADVRMLHKWINNRQLNKYLSAEIPVSLKKEKQWVDQALKNKNARHFIIERADTGEPIGVMSLNRINKRHRNALTGAFIAYPKYWGKGYGADAKMTLLKYAFLKLGLHRIESQVFTHNPRSLRYNQKCGYRREGLLRQNICKKGKFYDSIALAVLKPDWLKLAKKYDYI